MSHDTSDIDMLLHIKRYAPGLSLSENILKFLKSNFSWQLSIQTIKHHILRNFFQHSKDEITIT